jgi:hypothetical protein
VVVIMSDHTLDYPSEQLSLFETTNARSLLDELLENSRLYKCSKDYKELLDFVVRLRNFAPFNAMLLQVQKPGLSYAASACDWRERFGRWPKEGARPLLILWPFGPVALVYDVQDTEGEKLPKDVASFFASGKIDKSKLISFELLLKKKNIDWNWLDTGDQKAGVIRVVRRASDDKSATQYRIGINRNHEPAVQFVTLAHELGHLFLGHLGSDKKLNIPRRGSQDNAWQELEAESVAYLVSERNTVKSESYKYLSDFVNLDTKTDQLDLYQIMRAAGQIETLLGLNAHTHF